MCCLIEFSSFERASKLISANTATPAALERFLEALVRAGVRTSLMIWGPPGIGKSSIVEAVSKRLNLQLVDLRLSQLAPTDLRGLPVPRDGVSTWYPPEFLPRSGRGVLFLDEINLAPPAMQGIAQQLILDRRVGSYRLPDEWFVWAAGNRKEDRASVFEMPAPLANRFLHVSVEADFDSFREFALRTGIEEQVLAFLAFRPQLLHKTSPTEPAWPSPRSWMMASELHANGLSVAPAVGSDTAAEFSAFVRLYETMPNLDEILDGAREPEFPSEPSARYAVTIGLSVRCAGIEATSGQILNASLWLAPRAPLEWFQLFVTDVVRVGRSRSGGMERLQPMLEEPAVRKAVGEMRDALFG